MDDERLDKKEAVEMKASPFFGLESVHLLSSIGLVSIRPHLPLFQAVHC